MSNEKINKLTLLLRENKIKQAKRQLVENLMIYHNTDISGIEFVNYQISETIFKVVYSKNEDEFNYLKFPYDEETLLMKIDFIFDYFKKYWHEIVHFFPETSRFPISDSNHLYLEYPIALSLTLIQSKSLIIKLMSEKNTDVIVTSEGLNIGFIISEDEYSEVTIAYWGK
jgi:hypothetical protein